MASAGFGVRLRASARSSPASASAPRRPAGRRSWTCAGGRTRLPGLATAACARSRLRASCSSATGAEQVQADRRRRVPGHQLPLTAWFTAIYPSPRAERDQLDRAGAKARGRAATASLISARLMRAIGAREAESPARGRVEVDDAYLGGSTPQRHARPRCRGQDADRRHGRDHGRAQAEAAPAERWSRASARRRWNGSPNETSPPGAMSSATACPAGRRSEAGCQRFPMATGSGERAASWAPFKWVNTCLGNIKTALAGTYHHVGAKHAQSYLDGFAYRFDRRFQLDSIVERLAWPPSIPPRSPSSGYRLGCIIQPARKRNDFTMPSRSNMFIDLICDVLPNRHEFPPIMKDL